MMDTTAVEALRRSRGEPELFATFYRHHVGGLVAYLGRRVFEPEVAWDLAAESFAQAFLSRRRFRGHSDEEAAGWLYRIASRQLARYFRTTYVERRALRRLSIDPPELDAEQRERIEGLSETEGLRAAVRAELVELSAPQREALNLRIVEELPYAEVARRLAIGEEAARARVTRGLRALTAALPPSQAIKET